MCEYDSSTAIEPIERLDDELADFAEIQRVFGSYGGYMESDP